MKHSKRFLTGFLVVAALVLGCAPATTGPEGGREDRPVVKRITIATRLEPDTRPTGPGQARLIQPLVNSGLTTLDGQRMRHPMLVEAVPNLENGLWKLLPDGRMETTYRIRQGAQWHDGVLFTAEDLLFTLQLGRDRDLPGFRAPALSSIEGVSASDARTLVVTWREPSIDADGLLSLPGALGPLPKHRLEDAYGRDKAGLLDLLFWTHEYVGTGPYRVRDWVPDVGVALEAHGGYVLGRPKIDQIEVKSIPDANTLTANLLAGTVDLTLPVGGTDLAIQLRDQWRDGTVVFNPGSDLWLALFAQFVDPRPAAVADLRFRRALLHAIDRQEMVDTLVAGLAPVAHSFLSPNQALYREIEASLTRYEYDPRKASEILQDLGYAKGPDGVYRDAGGQRLEVEVRSGPLEGQFKAAVAVVDYWQRLGLAATAVRVSPQRVDDFEYVATFPAFQVFGRPNDVGALRSLHSSFARLPSNNFRVAGTDNVSRYMSPELDALIDRYSTTVPVPARNQVLGDILRHIADQLPVVGLHYILGAAAVSHRVLNVTQEWNAVFITWNAHEWDVR